MQNSVFRSLPFLAVFGEMHVSALLQREKTITPPRTWSPCPHTLHHSTFVHLAPCYIEYASIAYHRVCSSSPVQRSYATLRLKSASHQKHFACTMFGPVLSYSLFMMSIFWKFESCYTMDATIQTIHRRCGLAMTLTSIFWGANAFNSFVRRSPMPGNIVLPPLRTMSL